MATSRTAQLASAASTVLAAASAKLAGQLDAEPNVAAEVPDAQPVARVLETEVSKATATALVRAYRNAETRKKNADKALKEAKAKILDAMGPGDVLKVAETGKVCAEHKLVVSIVFNGTRFRDEHPDDVAPYMESQTSRRFRVVT